MSIAHRSSLRVKKSQQMIDAQKKYQRRMKEKTINTIGLQASQKESRLHTESFGRLERMRKTPHLHTVT